MISLCVPSRGRPSNIARLHASVHAGAVLDDWELVVRLDDDDPTGGDYPTLPRTRYLHGRRVVLSSMWNECWRAAQGPVFGLFGDDVVFATPGWDRMVLEAFPDDGIAYVHGDDLGGKGDRLGTHGFVRKEWTDAVGMFTPPYFSSDFNDLWLNEVADALGRRVFLPGLICEHLHPAFNKSEWDRTHLERIERHHADDCDAIWAETAPERDEWVRTLEAAIAGSQS